MDALPHDDMHPRHASPPQDVRPRTRARYGNNITLESGCVPSDGRKLSVDGLDKKKMVERAALWAESGSIWVPYGGSYVRVVMEAVVDVVRHPQLSCLLKHHGVPVMIISSAGQTAAEAKASFRYACHECDGKFEFHQEQRRGGAFQHIIPVVKLQVCCRGSPATDDLILEDIDERMVKSTVTQQMQRPEEQRVNSAILGDQDRLRRCDLQLSGGHHAFGGSRLNALFEASEPSTPLAIQVHRCCF